MEPAVNLHTKTSVTKPIILFLTAEHAYHKLISQEEGSRNRGEIQSSGLSGSQQANCLYHNLLEVQAVSSELHDELSLEL